MQASWKAQAEYKLEIDQLDKLARKLEYTSWKFSGLKISNQLENWPGCTA